MNYKKIAKQSGFMLIFAILVSSIIMTIGFGISNFLFRELILAFTGRNSSYSFYAGNTGVECDTYWEDIFGERGGSIFEDDPDGGKIYCAGQEVDWSNCGSGNCAKFKYQLYAGEDDKQYAEVRSEDIVPGGLPMRQMVGFGYNNNLPGNPKRVERAYDFRFSRQVTK